VGALGLLSRGVKIVRPVASVVRAAEAASESGGEIAIIPGHPEATRRLSILLGVPTLSSPTEDALAVMAVAPGTPDIEAGIAALARRRRSGAGALGILVGTPAERAELERELLEDHRLEPSNVAHVASLEGKGGERAVEAVVAALGRPGAVAAGRRYPCLRPAVGRALVRSASRQAATVGALPLGGADMPTLSLLQVGLVTLLAVLHDRPMGAEHGVQAAAVMGAGFGWRELGRAARRPLPVPRWVTGGTVAYVSTRAVGEAALARLASGHDLIEGPPIDAAKPLVARLLGKLKRDTRGEAS
jgi:uncharacterized protein (DUF697 family)